jgi:two-component system sensor histidine kinase RegB
MPDTGSIDLGRRASRLRLDTLVRLRWLAVAGQSVAVVGVHFGLGFALPFVECLAIIAVSGALNLALRTWFPLNHRLRDGAAWALLAFDTLQLAALLYLTGGLENPFSMLFLAPVMISATALPPWRTFGLGLLAISAATLLAFVYLPLPWGPDERLMLPLTYRAGIWSAILLGLAFIGAYAWRVAEEARQLAQALAATELVLAREQHLSQLDGLAAAAAHELGTPLATIALVAKELDRSGPQEGPVAEDIDLLNEQIGRCRDILRKLNSLEHEGAGPLETMRLGHLIEELASPHRPFELPIRVELSGQGPEPTCRRNPGLLYGLGNLVENAVDFAQHEVVITAHWTDTTVSVEVRDDGPGFPPEVLNRLGEPYVTTRGSGRRAKTERGGLGLGLFIAKTLLERSGAALDMRNATGSGGAVVTVQWPRLAFERRILAPSEPMEPAFPL